MTTTSATSKTLLDVSLLADRLGHSRHCDVAKGLRGELMECSLLVAPGLINGFVAVQQGTADWIFVGRERAREIPVTNDHYCPDHLIPYDGDTLGRGFICSACGLFRPAAAASEVPA